MKTDGRQALRPPKGPRFSQVMVQLFVYQQDGKRRLYPMEAISARRLRQRQERPAPPLEAYRLELVSVAEEMGATLEHAAFSANIKERRDYSCAIFSASGDLLAQAAHIPVHLGSQSESVRAVLRSGFVNPGESMVLNDPYAGGTHLPDITMVTPVFSPAKNLCFLWLRGRTTPMLVAHIPALCRCHSPAPGNL